MNNFCYWPESGMRTAMGGLLAVLVVVKSSSAHFPGLVCDDQHSPTRVAVYFAEYAEPNDTQQTSALPELPAPVTSFGAAKVGDSVYVYGGHTGEAHSYSLQEQSDALFRLDLANGGPWTVAATGPRLQGLALVSHDGKLYRVGGFTAKNKAGDPHALHSQDSVACFDPASSEWRDLRPLPEPRSSTDAVVLDGKLYVVGGWQLAGQEKSGQWHETAWILDLAAKSQAAHWEPLPKPPFQRRALALATHEGRIYAIGGMGKTGGPTTRVDCYDPSTGEWSSGPPLAGKPMNGFGCATSTLDGKLYVTCIRRLPATPQR